MISLLILLIVFELIEAYLQKGNTLIDVLLYLYIRYKQNIFYLFFMHVSFIYTLYLILILELNIYLLIMFGVKFLDIVFKIYLFQKADEDGLEIAFANFLSKESIDMRWLKFSNVIIYPVLLYSSIVESMS